MSRLQELIQELCPNGIEYKPLKDVIEMNRGVRVVRKQLAERGEIPVYQNSLTPMGYYDKSNCEANTTFVICAGAAGEIGYSDIPFWAADDCFYFLCGDGYLNRFLYHFLLTQQSYLYSQVRKASIPRLARSVLENLKIPVPPLPVQSEIVQILDNFTELTARKKQYEYYKDELFLAKKVETEFGKLGDLVDIGDGLHGTPLYDDNGSTYFINGNNIKNGHIVVSDATKRVSYDVYLKHRIVFDSNTIFMSINGTIGNVGMYDNEPIMLGKSVAYFNIHSDKLLPRYLFHLLQTSLSRKYYSENVTGGTIKNLGLKSLRQFPISLPSLKEQKRIVSILDRFDALCNDLTGGLPAEIEARRKQYEYYRDKLLTF